MMKSGAADPSVLRWPLYGRICKEEHEPRTGNNRAREVTQETGTHPSPHQNAVLCRASPFRQITCWEVNVKYVRKKNMKIMKKDESEVEQLNTSFDAVVPLLGT